MSISKKKQNKTLFECFFFFGGQVFYAKKTQMFFSNCITNTNSSLSYKSEWFCECLSLSLTLCIICNYVSFVFLQVASSLSKNVVYSLHKTSTRQHILKKAEEFNLSGEVVAELRYNLPKTYKFHKKASVDVQVDFFRFTKVSESWRI